MFPFNTWLEISETDKERYIRETDWKMENSCPVMLGVPMWCLCTMQCLSSIHNFGAAFPCRVWQDLSQSHINFHMQDRWGGVLHAWDCKFHSLCFYACEYFWTCACFYGLICVFKPLCVHVCVCLLAWLRAFKWLLTLDWQLRKMDELHRVDSRKSDVVGWLCVFVCLLVREPASLCVYVRAEGGHLLTDRHFSLSGFGKKRWDDHMCVIDFLFKKMYPQQLLSARHKTEPELQWA